MMKSMRIILVFIVICFLSANVSAGEFSEISLTDGSIIYGEIKSFNAGVYTVKSAAFGLFRISESDIQQIRPRADSIKKREKANPETPSVSSDLLALQEMMGRDKEIMNLIVALQNDPDFLEIISDPDILHAVNTGDIGALLSNSKFMNLLNNQKIQEIQKRLAD
jgi:hypothetical protein